MGVLDSLLAGGIQGVAAGIGQLAKDIRTAITGQTPLDPNKQAELLMHMQMIEAAAVKAATDYDTLQMQAQLAINKAEAESAGAYKGGWRPFIGWVCGFGFLYEVLIRTLVPWIYVVVTGKPILAMTPLDSGTLMTVMLGMLGLGGMRTYEKISGRK